MGPRWTTTRVAALPPSQTAYTDPAQVGLILEVRERSGKPPSRAFYHRFQFKGQPAKLLLGHFPETTLEKARSLAHEYRELASQGIDPRKARPKRRRHGRSPAQPASTKASDPHSIEFLVAEFREHELVNRKRPEYAERIIAKEILPVLGGRDARTIRPREIVELLDPITKRAPVMANRVAALLRQLFKLGIQRAIVEDTPVKLLHPPGGRQLPRDRVLSDGELRAFLADPTAATRFPRLAIVVMILLLTGQRRGELSQAKWKDIDFRAKTWTIPKENAKNAREHVVPLSNWAVQEFKALKAADGDSPWVLPSKPGTDSLDPRFLSQSILKCAQRFKKQGIARFSLHDLRRTCRTNLARLGVEPHVAERVLNHVQPGIIGVYDRHAYLDEMREALDKWAAHLQGLRG